MGYLTTITIYNDGCDQLIKNKEKVADILYNACYRDLPNGCSCQEKFKKTGRKQDEKEPSVYRNDFCFSAHNIGLIAQRYIKRF